jgi:hypothetical protein
VGNRFNSDACLAILDLFSRGCIDLDRQAWDERARATVAREDHRPGDEEFHGGVSSAGHICEMPSPEKTMPTKVSLVGAFFSTTGSLYLVV